MPPSLDDDRSIQRRISDALGKARLSAEMLRELPLVCERSDWSLTVSLALMGDEWEVVRLEEGDQSQAHYGFAADIGSTTIVMQLVNCCTREVVRQESAPNRQIAFGEDILTRIFYGKDAPAHVEELRRALVHTLKELMQSLTEKSGISMEDCISMVLAGNTTMTHFLLGLDAFCVFSSPYALCTDEPGFFWGRELGLPLCGSVFLYPSKANYIGGDIISGLAATGMAKKETISVFFDMGTNGELVIGNREFLLCAAGAAGPALEGGVVSTGMRATDGAVEHLSLKKGQNGSWMFDTEVIGKGVPKGICGSGIIDLIAELFLHGFVDLRGKLQEEASETVVRQNPEGNLAVNYAPGLWFDQRDLDAFIRTKAAAYTMMDVLLSRIGLSEDEVQDFYMAGAFGDHVKPKSAVTIGMYPDVPPEKLHAVGNTSLAGARALLLDAGLLGELPKILDLMTYVQFGAEGNFLEKMTAALALPHTDIRRFPSVQASLNRL